MWSLHVILILLILIQANNIIEAKNLVLPTSNNGTNHENSSIIEVKPSIRKCCGLKEYVRKKQCMTGLAFSYDQIPVFTTKLKATSKKIPDVFELVPYRLKDEAFDLSYSAQAAGFRIYLTEDGFLHLDLPNAYNRWQVLNESQFCVDFRAKKTSNILNPVFYIVLPDEQHATTNMFFEIAMYVSCVFLLLVLVVYSLIKELRNMGGKILMAYVASLLMSFLFLAVIQAPGYEVRTCQLLTYTIYFSFLASFCWMNVMSYDIWWTFRGYAKARRIHRRGENFKFLMYCLYAWGVPFTMTIIFSYLNETPLQDYPWLITPKIPQKGCFLEGGEKLLYLYVPMLILIICNWLFYLMTAFNLWRLSRGTAVLDSAAAGTPAAHRSQRHRFLVYLNLSIVMGLNWVLEIVSFVYPGFKVWYITDTYNIFIGLAIFVIFCCKGKIFRKLVKIFKNKKKRWSPSSKSISSNTSDSTASQETSLPLVCPNPKGPSVQIR